MKWISTQTPNTVSMLVPIRALHRPDFAPIPGRIEKIARRWRAVQDGYVEGMDAPIISAWSDEMTVVDGRHRIMYAISKGERVILCDTNKEDYPHVVEVLSRWLRNFN